MSPAGLPRDLIAVRVARELAPGSVVNLGIGLPTEVANYVPQESGVWFQAENGVLGYGPINADSPEPELDPDMINAGGQPITLWPGASFFDSAASFSMIRGGHIDVSVLGGLQVSARGDLANWMVPERGGGSIGGAMDLAVGARRLIVAMMHTTARGLPRLVEECSYPLTATACVDLVITDLAVIEVTAEGFALRERAPGVAAEEIARMTAAPLSIGANVPEMSL